MEEKGYFLGLDMGTNSVGWAVTDESYNLIRKKGKDLWGIREFEEASPAAERRQSRISRRRRAKEVVRLGLIKSYFDEEIRKVDPDFFTRLENSKYHLEDKDDIVRYKYSIFNDENYTDADYYKQYKTIFHLRKELIENEEKHDVRLVYLAIANMFKHRGHFLNEALSTSDGVRDMNLIYDEFRNTFIEVCQAEDELTTGFIDVAGESIKEILGDRECSRTVKSEKLADLLKLDKKDKNDKVKIECVKCICGLKVDVQKIFSGLDLEEKYEICFNDFSYEDKVPEIIDTVGEDNYRLVEIMRELYNAGILSGILKGSGYLSLARVEEYEKHKADLEVLKRVYRKFGTQEEYNNMFRTGTDSSYSAYVNSYNSGEKRRRDMGGNAKRNAEALYKTINKFLKDEKADGADVEYIRKAIENENFLPKQLTGSNGVIPNQVHKMELQKILSNAEKYLPFLNEKDESGMTVSERIVALFSFHVPYYIGPVTENSEKNKGNGWVVRKEAGAVYPWNIKQKINEEETREKFITRMVRECTYLRGEKVLPKASLEYEAYCVLNEINNLRIDGEKISVELKQSIYKELFQRGKKVSRKDIEKYLMGKGVLESSEQLTGIDITINNSLSSYGKFKAVFGDKINEDSYQSMAEQIIFWGTVYGDSKNILKDCIEKKYGDILSPEQIKRIMGYKFIDWGNMSKEFLELPGCDVATGECASLIRSLWNTNNNLMELINSPVYTFKNELEDRKAEALNNLKSIQYEDLNDFYFSAPVKRMVWQTILVIKEVTQIMGKEPEKTFIEMTRTDEEKGDKGRKDSRKKQLLELYKSIDDEGRDWKKIIEDADSSGKLRSKKMYLYLTQMGRDMYTGEEINLDDLFKDNVYDIDHIYPRSFVKDDSLSNNLVLVNKSANNRKQNYYPLDEKIANNPKVRNLWSCLHKNKLINDTKYQRLTSRSEFTEDQKAGFIARQLVETSQATKGIADIIKAICPQTKIVYSKAGNVSEFRHQYKLLKSRTVNDFHHANDAYLNIVVGNAYNVKFTDNPYNFIKKDYASGDAKYNYHLGKMFEKDIVRDGKIGWIAQHDDGNPGTIETVKKVMAKNTPMMTRMNFVGKGAIANATIYPASKAKADAYIPLKTSEVRLKDVTKYGGFTSVSTAYFALIESEKKGKKIRTLEAVPVYLVKRIEKDEKELENYCVEKCGLINPRIVIGKIKIQSLIKLNGFYVYISGKTLDRCVLKNAVNLCVSQSWKDYIHDIEKGAEKVELAETIDLEKNIELYDLLTKKHIEEIFSKRPNPVGKKLQDGREKFVTLSVEEQCAVLNEIIKLNVIGNTSADLSAVGGAAKSGVMLTSKVISENDEVKLINQSVTGFYEKTVDLLTV